MLLFKYCYLFYVIIQGFQNQIIGVTGNVLKEDIDYFIECGAEQVLLCEYYCYNDIVITTFMYKLQASVTIIYTLGSR